MHLNNGVVNLISIGRHNLQNSTQNFWVSHTFWRYVNNKSSKQIDWVFFSNFVRLENQILNSFTHTMMEVKSAMKAVYNLHEIFMQYNNSRKHIMNEFKLTASIDSTMTIFCLFEMIFSVERMVSQENKAVAFAKCEVFCEFFLYVEFIMIDVS